MCNLPPSSKHCPPIVGGGQLDVARWTRRSVSEGPATAPSESAHATLSALGQTHTLRHLVIGVIGPREATDAQLAAAKAIGKALGALGLTLICGGRTGVMTAVSEGCASAGGLMIGILPGSTPEEANPFVTIPLPTGLGEARNMVIAKSARVLIAIGGSYGTLSEVAYGLHFSKTVIGLEGAPEVKGVTHAGSVDEAVELACAALIAAAPIEDAPADV